MVCRARKREFLPVLPLEEWRKGTLLAGNVGVRGLHFKSCRFRVRLAKNADSTLLKAELAIDCSALVASGRRGRPGT